MRTCIVGISIEPASKKSRSGEVFTGIALIAIFGFLAINLVMFQEPRSFIAAILFSGVAVQGFRMLGRTQSMATLGIVVSLICVVFGFYFSNLQDATRSKAESRCPITSNWETGKASAFRCNMAEFRRDKEAAYLFPSEQKTSLPSKQGFSPFLDTTVTRFMSSRKLVNPEQGK